MINTLDALNEKGFIAQLVGPEIVEIHEIGDTYRMSRTDVETAIENVKTNRHKYTDIAYRHRLEFFQEILGVFDKEKE